MTMLLFWMTGIGGESVVLSTNIHILSELCCRASGRG